MKLGGTKQELCTVAIVLAIISQLAGLSITNKKAIAAETSVQGLKIGSLLPVSGDLASLGQPMAEAVSLLVETVNQCGGVNGASVSLVQLDDKADPTIATARMTQLAQVDKVAGVVGSFASSTSFAALNIADRNQVMLISPGSVAPIFTENAPRFRGYWARTIASDQNQPRALARLAYSRGLRRVSTFSINNDYGIGFEREFIRTFKRLGGSIINESKPIRYDPRSRQFDALAKEVFRGKPDGVLAVAYGSSGALILKAAYSQGLLQGIQILLPDSAATSEFPEAVGKKSNGNYILAGSIGTLPIPNGNGLPELERLWKVKKGKELPKFAPYAWDAAAILVLSAQAARANTGDSIRSKVREVTNPPGIEITDVCRGLEFLRQGKKINYQGASGSADIDANGDVPGSYGVWQVQDIGDNVLIGVVHENGLVELGTSPKH